MFELLSSEVSYLLSLDVLIHHFMESPGISPHLLEGRGVFHEQQHEMIFSNLREVREASAQFLSVLHSRRSEGVVVRNISDIILEFVSVRRKELVYKEILDLIIFMMQVLILCLC